MFRVVGGLLPGLPGGVPEGGREAPLPQGDRAGGAGGRQRGSEVVLQCLEWTYEAVSE